MREILLFARADDAYMKTIPIIAKTKSGLVHFKLRMYCSKVADHSSCRVHIKLYALTNSTQKLKLVEGGGQFSYTIFQQSPSYRATFGSQT